MKRTLPQIQYSRLLSLYNKLNKRLHTHFAAGRFHKFSRAQQRLLVTRIERLKTQLSLLENRAKLAGAALLAGTILATNEATAQFAASGSNFIVNTYTTNSQISPAIATDSAGDFVITWASNNEAGSSSEYDIYAQRYNGEGVAQGSQFLVNTFITGYQSNPKIAMDDDGDFVISWQSYNEAGSSSKFDIYAQRFNATGVVQGSQFLVNTFTTNQQSFPSIVMDNDGNFVITWQSLGQDGSGDGVYAQLYNAAGAPQGTEFKVNTFTTGNQKVPSIAMDSVGDFVIVWESYWQDGSGYGVYAQSYNTTGVAKGSEFLVNTTTDYQLNPSVAMDYQGDFIITWQSYDGTSSDIFAKRYNSAGVALGSEFLVNTFTTGNQEKPSIAMDSQGDFVISWQSYNETGSSSKYDIYAQRYNTAGVAQGSEFLVNTYTTYNQKAPAIAADRKGDFVIAWEINHEADPASLYDIYAQHYTGGFMQQPIASTGGATIFCNGDSVTLKASSGVKGVTYQWCNNGTAIVGATDTSYVAFTTGNYTVTIVNADSSASEASKGILVTVIPPPSASNAGTTQYITADTTTLAANVPAIGKGKWSVVSGTATIANDTLATTTVSGLSSGVNLLQWTIKNGTCPDSTSSNVNINLGLTLITPTISGADTIMPNQTGVTYSVPYDSSFTYQWTLPGGAIITSSKTDSNTITIGFGMVGGVLSVKETNNYGNTTSSLFINTNSSASINFQVNTFTAGNQGHPSIASDSAGDFVIVWQSYDEAGPGSSYDIYAQRYNAAGVTQGGEFLVNTYTSNRQVYPTVAMDSKGDFIIVWTSWGLNAGIYAQRYNATGVAQGANFLVNPNYALDQPNPMATDSQGDFVITWQAEVTDNSTFGIFAKCFNASGVAQQSEFQVNEYTTYTQTFPSVAMDSAGDFVIAWMNTDGSYDGIYAQRYNVAGVAQGSEFLVNTYTTNQQSLPSIAMDRKDNFVITWTSDDGANFISNKNIHAQLYNAAGVRQGSEFVVNTYTTNTQSNSSIAMDSQGDFVITWESYTTVRQFQIYAKRFNAAGIAQESTEFQVNTYTTSNQQYPCIAMDYRGDFVIAWQSPYEDGSGYGIYARRYTADSATLVATAVTSQTGVSLFNLYPNPAQGQVQISLNGNASVRVMDMTGHVLMEQPLQGNTLNIGNLNAGMYMVEVALNGATEVKKLIVQQ